MVRIWYPASPIVSGSFSTACYPSKNSPTTWADLAMLAIASTLGQGSNHCKAKAVASRLMKQPQRIRGDPCKGSVALSLDNAEALQDRHTTVASTECVPRVQNAGSCRRDGREVEVYRKVGTLKRGRV